MRYVVWENDTPKYFCDSDYDMLINREELFARKFNVSYSGQLVNKLKMRKRGDINEKDNNIWYLRFVTLWTY